MPNQNNIPSKTKLYILACALLILVSLSGYWLKTRIGIDFFEGSTLSKYFPFNYLVPNNVLDDPPPGIILDDSFDSFSLFGNWTDLWMREQGKVAKGYDQKGRNNSRCLVIKSSSTKSWSSSYKKYVRVKKGDVFSFKVSAKLQGDTIAGYAGIATFDEKKQAISWNYISGKIDRTDEWVTVEKTFTIPEGITYIRFKLSGTGSGETRFDDIVFEKL